MEFSLPERTIFLTLHGSQAYGMARPESDVDLRGIAIPTAPYFHGYLRQFEQSEEEFPRRFDVGGITFLEKIQNLVGRTIPANEKIDSVVYDIRKIIHLATLGNPNIYDILWADESCHIIRTKLVEPLLENRDLFLSTKVRWSYSGYAIAQLKRIKLHRQHLLHPPDHKPTRDEFGLPERTVIPRDQLMAAESLIARKIEEWLGSKEELSKDVLLEMRQRTVQAIRDIWAALASELITDKGAIGELLGMLPVTEDDAIDEGKVSRAAGKLLGYDSNFLELLDRERGYRSASRQWQQYEEWKKNRNPARAEMEARFGYDCKHASHLVRLMRQAKQILETGKVLVKRPDAAELLAIRNGAWPYERLIEWAEQQDKELDEFYASGKSPLPREPDRVAVDALCQRIVEESMK
jgi:uncharacterized protein